MNPEALRRHCHGEIDMLKAIPIIPSNAGSISGRISAYQDVLARLDAEPPMATRIQKLVARIKKRSITKAEKHFGQGIGALGPKKSVTRDMAARLVRCLK